MNSNEYLEFVKGEEIIDAETINKDRSALKASF